MATVELTEKEYLDFLEFQKIKKEQRKEDIPNEITKVDEESKIKKEKLKQEKKDLTAELKDITKKIKDANKKITDDENINQEDIQSKYQNKNSL